MPTTTIIKANDITPGSLNGVCLVLFCKILESIAPAGTVGLVKENVTFTGDQKYIDFAKAQVEAISQHHSIKFILAVTETVTAKGFKTKMQKRFQLPINHSAGN